MFVSIGEITHGGERRSGQPVRKHSREKGRCEGLFWRKISKSEALRIMDGARRYDEAARATGERQGPLGPVGLQLLNYLTALSLKSGGRVEPSYEYLMAKLRRSRDAIHRALKALRDHGFLDWLRRYVPTGNEGPGPRVKQTSNAYRLSLPARAARLLGRPAPLPDDFTHGKAQQDAALTAMLDSASMEEQMAFRFGRGDPLGEALARLGNAVTKRGSAVQSESMI